MASAIQRPLLGTRESHEQQLANALAEHERLEAHIFRLEQQLANREYERTASEVRKHKLLEDRLGAVDNMAKEVMERWGSTNEFQKVDLVCSDLIRRGGFGEALDYMERVRSLVETVVHKLSARVSVEGRGQLDARKETKPMMLSTAAQAAKRAKKEAEKLAREAAERDRLKQANEKKQPTSASAAAGDSAPAVPAIVRVKEQKTPEELVRAERERWQSEVVRLEAETTELKSHLKRSEDECRELKSSLAHARQAQQESTQRASVRNIESIGAKDAVEAIQRTNDSLEAKISSMTTLLRKAEAERKRAGQQSAQVRAKLNEEEVARKEAHLKAEVLADEIGRLQADVGAAQGESKAFESRAKKAEKRRTDVEASTSAELARMQALLQSKDDAIRLLRSKAGVSDTEPASTPAPAPAAAPAAEEEEATVSTPAPDGPPPRHGKHRAEERRKLAMAYGSAKKRSAGAAGPSTPARSTPARTPARPTIPEALMVRISRNVGTGAESKPWVVHSKSSDAGDKSEPCSQLVVLGAHDVRSTMDKDKHLGSCLELAGVVSWEGRVCVISAPASLEVKSDRGSLIGG